MSETSNRPGAAPNGAPVMRVVTQYLKDLSFESPEAPQSMMSGEQGQPAVDVGVDVGARKLENDQYEVELSCKVTATRDDKTVFVVETNYAGLFLIQNLSQEQLEPALLVEAPRLLFPFMRKIVDNAVREGNFFMPLLEPLDFAGMYRMQKARQQEATAQGDAGTA